MVIRPPSIEIPTPHGQQVEELLPDVESQGWCPTGKRRWDNPEDAAEALRRVRHNRRVTNAPEVEKRWYPQEGDRPCQCGGYHLTSKGK